MLSDRRLAVPFFFFSIFKEKQCYVNFIIVYQGMFIRDQFGLCLGNNG